MNLLTKLFIPLILFGLLSSKSQETFLVEICNNGIDDDQDGLIDINDEDCFCPFLEVPSLIPNPSFEDQDCCPSTHSSLHCAIGWAQASEPTPDYFHTCDWVGHGLQSIPQPLPDGEGFVGFFDGAFEADIITPNWKEYVGACLIDTLVADSIYMLQLSVGFLDRELSPPMNLTIFGTTDCSNFPFGEGDFNFGCPTNGPGWTKLGSVGVAGDSEWKEYNISLFPKTNITALVIGPDCPPLSLVKNPYYFLDNLTLAKPNDFDIDILVNDQPCADNLTFEIPSQDNSSYQWYMDGIAIQGAITSILINPLGEGEYQVRIENQRGCNISRPYRHVLPFESTQITHSICRGSTYMFDNQQLIMPGIYFDTLKTEDNCDSIIRLELIVRDSIESQVAIKIFPSENYSIGEFSFDTPGEYVQTISSGTGCDSTIFLDLDFYSVYIPNIFSPNDDGVNDIFSIDGSLELESIMTLNIFDRWGNLTYQGKSLTSGEGWNGWTNGSRAQSGVYVFSASILMDDLIPRTIHGSFTLVR